MNVVNDAKKIIKLNKSDESNKGSMNASQLSGKQGDESFVSLSVEPMLVDDKEDASHQIIEQGNKKLEVVVPVMPLV